MDPSWIAADQTVLADGINSAFRPDQIGNNQAAWASNISIRDGKPRSREYNLVQRALLPKCLVQGAGFFSAAGGHWGDGGRYRCQHRSGFLGRDQLENRMT